jgi:hypothetical protein
MLSFSAAALLLLFSLPSTSDLSTFEYPKTLQQISEPARMLELLQAYNRAIVRTTEVLSLFIFLVVCVLVGSTLSIPSTARMIEVLANTPPQPSSGADSGAGSKVRADFDLGTNVISASQATLMNVIDKPVTARRDRIGLAIAGGLFVLIMLGSDWIRSPTRFQERSFVIALALAAGAAGGFIPGAIVIDGKRPSVAVRATVAVGLAAFIIILFYRFIA